MPAVAPGNPCLSCGACCASFRVSFYWRETVALGLPEPMSKKVDDRYAKVIIGN
jgi:Fe-S-cluster containining protein